MCAINGFTFEDKSLVEAMNRATAHRGPDGTGVWVKDGISLGHNRLSIIDLSPQGAQPMVSAEESLVITYNGEIYNFAQLREELKGYPFKSKTDTEVILAAYRAWGRDAFARFNGMFALALWDAQKRELVLARDRSGIKPLYYYVDSKTLIFSSEVKGLLAHDIPRVLNPESLLHYLRVQYVPGEATLLKGIKRLMPGTLLIYKEGSITTTGFAPQEIGKNPVTEEELRHTIGVAVDRQLVSDRPVGVYLSGGFDSNILLAEATRARGTVTTFSVGFDLGEGHPRQAFFNADLELARKSAAHFGAKHHEFVLGQSELAPLFTQMIRHLDDPVGNATSLPMLFLAARAKASVAVALSGDGGDELFGGYERYRLSLLASYYRRPPAFMRRIGAIDPQLRKLDTAPGVARFAQFMFQKDAELSRVLKAPQDLQATARFFESQHFTPVDTDFERQFMEVDRRTWLVDEALARTDKMAMAAGLEVRVPLLDDEVLSLARRLRTSQKVTLGATKAMLKRAYRGVLPPHLYGQEKRGWFSPGGEWIKGGAFGALVEEVLAPAYYPESAHLFNFDEIRTMLERHRRGEEYHMVMLWSLLTLVAWMKEFGVRIK